MYIRVGNAIQAIHPDPLIIAEGPMNWVESYAGAGPAPEGDLTLVRTHPVVLTMRNKVYIV